MSTLSKEDKETRLNGRPSGQGGLVYPQFDFNVHVYTEVPQGWAAKDDPPGQYTCRAYIDPHTSTPTAILCAATGPGGRTFFFSHCFEKYNWPEIACAVQERMEGRFWHFTLADPWIFNESNFDDSTGADDLAKCGLFVEKAPKDLKRGIKAVQEALAARDANGDPILMFSDELYVLLEEIDNYVWNPKKPDSPIDKDDHFMENLYRAVISGLDYIDLSEAVEKFIPQAAEKFDLSIPKQSDFVDKQAEADYLRDWREMCEDGNG